MNEQLKKEADTMLGQFMCIGLDVTEDYSLIRKIAKKSCILHYALLAKQLEFLSYYNVNSDIKKYNDIINYLENE